MSAQLKIHYRNFEPKRRQKRHTERVISQIQGLAPSDASVKGAVAQKPDGFEGKIRLTSTMGVFFARAKSKDIFSLMVKLQERIDRQLKKWKNTRFTKKHRRQLSILPSSE